MDLRIQGYIGKRGIIYTRYADDITLSGIMPNKVIGALPFVNKIIQEEGFQLNKTKTRFTSKLRRREITGLVLYNNSYGIGRDKYRLIRSKIFNLTKTIEKVTSKDVNHILGWLSYIKSVDLIRYELLTKDIKKLNKSHPKSDIQKLQLFVTKKVND